jgi:hypothetical protein
MNVIHSQHVKMLVGLNGNAKAYFGFLFEFEEVVEDFVLFHFWGNLRNLRNLKSLRTLRTLRTLG